MAPQSACNNLNDSTSETDSDFYSEETASPLRPSIRMSEEFGSRCPSPLLRLPLTTPANHHIRSERDLGAILLQASALTDGTHAAVFRYPAVSVPRRQQQQQPPLQ